ncbi:MAG: hypothetical protein ACLQG3_08370 [Terracidiphilus sp.]
MLPLLAAFVFSASAGFSQTLTWSTPERDTTTPMGGESGRPGVGAVNWNGYLWVAYLGTSTVDSAGDFSVYTAYNSGGINFGNKNQVTPGNSAQTVAALGNPSLVVYNGDLYLFYNDAYGEANYIYTSDGVNWSQVYTYAGLGYFIDASQSAAVYNGLIYVGFRNHADYSLILATIDSSNDTSWTNFPSVTLNFNPGLAVFNDSLYIAIETDANSHNLYYYTTTGGTTLLGPYTGTATNQSSTAPTLAVFNNVLYLGFRSNDSKDNFLYMYSTDGVNWSSSIEPHVGIGGNPILAVAPDLPGSYNGDIFFFWASESSPNFYLCSMHAPVP